MPDIFLLLNALIFLFWSVPFWMTATILWAVFRIIITVFAYEGMSDEVVSLALLNGSNAVHNILSAVWNFARYDYPIIAFIYWVWVLWLAYGPRS